MEYFEIETDDKKKKRVKQKNFKFNRIRFIHLLILFSFLSILFFLFLNFIFPKGSKESKGELNEENPKMDSNDFSLEQSLETNPHYHTEFIMNLLSNYNKIDFNNFERNLKITVQKIYSITS